MNKNDERIRVCQESLLKLIDFFHSLCVENGIKYTLDCGTLLGAVREGGFIEWDDDADVSLTRTEYEKLKKVLKNTKFPNDIGFYNPYDKNYFLDFHLRLYDKSTIIRDDDDSKNNYDGLYTHPTLDIFVYDKIPKNKIKNKIYIFNLQLVWGLAMSKRHKVTMKKYKFIEKIGIFILGIVGRFLTIKNIMMLYDSVAKSYMNSDNCALYCTSWASTYSIYQYDIKYFNDFVLKKFENKMFYISSYYDKILTIGYGDYMTPKKTHTHDNLIKNI